MKFEYENDKLFFKNLLCNEDEKIEKFSQLFDFRNPYQKRKEFASNRNKILDQFIIQKGKICELNFTNICNLSSGFNIDHIIPLSSNILNKTLRKLPSEKGKKVRTQSFGSNNECNLILSCKKCNNHKKHRFLEKDKIRELLKNKF